MFPEVPVEKRFRIDVFPDRLVVEYTIEPTETMQVWTHAGELRAQGWRMLSIDSQALTLADRHDIWIWIRLRKADATVLRYTVLYEKVEDPPAAS